MVYKESEILELKKSTSELKEAIISIVAILNKHGKGKLFFGIKDNGTIVGQQVGKDTLKDITRYISENIESKIFPFVKIVKIKKKDCIKVEFTGNNKLYYAYGIPYIRVGVENRRLSIPEIERIIIEENKRRSDWDSETSAKSVKDANANVLRQYLKRANATGRISFKYDNAKSVLNKLGLLSKNKILKAGEILFCENNTLEVQIAVFAGKDKLTFIDIGVIKGNLFNVIRDTGNYIKKNINWRADLTDSGRKEIPEIPSRAITEAIVNSLCHRDYTNPKSNEVAIFKDRVEIYNPGQFPVDYSPSDYIKGTERSILRNPLIANCLYLSSDIERWGSGLKRIYNLCKEQKGKVEFKKLKSGFLVIFYRLSPQVTPQVTPQVKLTNLEEKIIKLIILNPKMSRKEIAKKLRIGPDTIKEYLKKLKNKRVIVRRGITSSGHWEVIK